MFHVFCCGKRRGLLNGVLVCPRCDHAGESGPDENQVKDVPDGVKMFTPSRVGE